MCHMEFRAISVQKVTDQKSLLFPIIFTIQVEINISYMLENARKEDLNTIFPYKHFDN